MCIMLEVSFIKLSFNLLLIKLISKGFSYLLFSSFFIVLTKLGHLEVQLPQLHPLDFFFKLLKSKNVANATISIVINISNMISPL
jgi:hypothetical protein